MTISFLSLGTLVPIPDSSPRAGGGVGHSFVGFSVWGGFEALACLLQLVGLLWLGGDGRLIVHMRPRIGSLYESEPLSPCA
jgi:hypothetical protein